MAEQIKTISDKSIFGNILNKEAFLKTKNGTFKMQFNNYADEIAAFKIPSLKNFCDNCIIF